MTVARYAPSPTGHWHLEHAFAAFNTWKRVPDERRVLQRMKNIDPGKCRPKFAAGIRDDLEWLGLQRDGPVRVQSGHLPDNQAVPDGLALSDWWYPGVCSRTDIARDIAASVSAPRASRRERSSCGSISHNNASGGVPNGGDASGGGYGSNQPA